MTIEGGYENVKSFIKAIETNVRVATIKNFSLTAVPGANEIYSLNLMVEIYYQEK